MKLLIASLILAASAFAQSTVVPLSVTIPNAAIVDLYTVSHATFNDPATPLALGASVLVGDTTITLNTAGMPATGAILLESEVMTYTGLTSTSITGVNRGAQLTTAAAHQITDPPQTVHVLAFPTLPSFLKTLLAPGVQRIIQSLGTSSAFLAATQAASTAASNAAQVALAGTVQ